MINIDSIHGRASLVVVQSAAMIEIGAMPLWVGSLMGHYGFDPREAGSLISLYLVGVVVGCFITAPVFGRLRSGKVMATTGMAIAAVAFLLLAKSSSYSEMVALHILGGLSIGPVLAATQGTIGRSSNPHRLYAIAAVSGSLIAACFLGIMPALVDRLGGELFFQVVAAVFAVGSLAALFGFPGLDLDAMAKLIDEKQSIDGGRAKIPLNVWILFVGLMCMSTVFAMTMSFVERVGMSREYGLAAISAVLTAMAIAKLLPAALAALLQNRLTVRSVLLTVPILQALFSAAIFAVPSVIIYAIAAPLFMTTMLFVQVFAFGEIAKLEPTGRANALSPSLIMVGAMIGPVLGGSIVKAAGYPSLAVVSLVAAIIAVYLFSRVTGSLTTK